MQDLLVLALEQEVLPSIGLRGKNPRKAFHRKVLLAAQPKGQGLVHLRV